jgi:hypothetical protein
MELETINHAWQRSTELSGNKSRRTTRIPNNRFLKGTENLHLRGIPKRRRRDGETEKAITDDDHTCLSLNTKGTIIHSRLSGLELTE